MHTPSLALIAAAATGGAAGAVIRFLLAHATKHNPWTILAINLIGCLAIGLVIGWVRSRAPLQDHWHSAIVVGLLGSLTTFSTFAADTLNLLNNNRPLAAFTYLATSVGLGITLCAIAWWCMHATAPR